MLLLSNVCTFFILFSTELTLSLFIIKLKFTWKMFFIWIFIWNLVVTAWKNLPLWNLLVLWRIYFKWQSRTFLEPSLLGLCCYWFMRMVSVEFCCVQVLTGVFFVVLQAQFAYSPSVTCTGAALVWRVLAAWHHSVVLWSNFFLISLFTLQ